MRCAAAPISTEKLPAPAPTATSRPCVKIRPQLEPHSGVSAMPSAITTMPPSSTGRAPQRSAAAPASGWIAPQLNCAMAKAKLMVAMPRPVEVLIGPRNRPSDWRAPMVTIRMPAAARVMARAPGSLSLESMGRGDPGGWPQPRAGCRLRR